MSTWVDLSRVDTSLYRKLCDHQDPSGGHLNVVCKPKMDTARKIIWEMFARLGKDTSTMSSPTTLPECWAVVRAWLIAWNISTVTFIGAHRIPGRLVELVDAALGDLVDVMYTVDGLDACENPKVFERFPQVEPDDLERAARSWRSAPIPLMVASRIFDSTAADIFKAASQRARHATRRAVDDQAWFVDLEDEAARGLEAGFDHIDPEHCVAAADGIEAGLAANGYRWSDTPGRIHDLLTSKPSPVGGLRHFREPTAGAAVVLASLGFTPEETTGLTIDQITIGTGAVTVAGRPVQTAPARQALAAQVARFEHLANGQILARHGRTSTRDDIVDMVRRGVLQAGGHLVA